MVGSRREAVGSILSRMTGLLKSGAVKQEDRPIWYDIVSRFPPKPLPPVHEIKKVIYPEDFVRAHFYRTFVEKSPTLLTNEKTKSIPERFIDTYLELHSKKVGPPEEIFQKTVDLLKTEGVQLQTIKEKEEIELARRQSIPTSSVKYDSPDDGFTDTVRRVDEPIEKGSPPKYKARHIKVDLDSLYSMDK